MMSEETTGQQRPPKAVSLFSQTKGLLRRYNLKAKKSLGQHFLIDLETLRLIISAAEITSDDVVMEIGPGLGVLTRALAEKAGRVLAIELDDKLAEILTDDLASSSNVTVIHQDILEIEPGALLAEQKVIVPPDPPDYKVVANLPYYITSLVLRHFLEAQVKPKLMVLMVQKEVAETIVAKSGDTRLLSISVQFYGKPEIVSKVPARCFYPEPEVDSAILRIDLYPKPPVAVSDTESFFQLVRAGFSAPRKQIHNALSRRLSLPNTEVLSFLERAGIMPQRRAQTLSLEEWARLWRVYSGVEK